MRGGYYYEQPQEAKKHVDDNDDDSFATLKKLALELFEDTLQDANFVIATCSNAAMRRCVNPPN